MNLLLAPQPRRHSLVPVSVVEPCGYFQQPPVDGSDAAQGAVSGLPLDETLPEGVRAELAARRAHRPLTQPGHTVRTHGMVTQPGHTAVTWQHRIQWALIS